MHANVQPMYRIYGEDAYRAGFYNFLKHYNKIICTATSLHVLSKILEQSKGMS